MSVLKRFTVLLFVFSSCIYAQKNAKFFRKDYTYLEDTRSFYKFQTVHASWQDAKKKCSSEGARLFYPEDRKEVDVILKFWNETQPFSWVFIGVSDLLAKGVFETIDGHPIEDVFHEWAPGEPNDAGGIEDCVILRRSDVKLNDDQCSKKYPYICKKSLDTLEWSTSCDMPEMGYEYNSALGKCYKFHVNPLNWTDAYLTCSTELSYLAIINTQGEADYLVNLTERSPKEKAKGNFLNGAVYLGFHNRDGDGWKTIKGGTSLEDSGYAKWGNQQPDGGDKEQCGSMFFNGHLNDLECKHRCFFVCEHDIGILSTSFDDRFSKE